MPLYTSYISFYLVAGCAEQMHCSIDRKLMQANTTSLLAEFQSQSACHATNIYLHSWYLNKFLL